VVVEQRGPEPVAREYRERASVRWVEMAVVVAVAFKIGSSAYFIRPPSLLSLTRFIFLGAKHESKKATFPVVD